MGVKYKKVLPYSGENVYLPDVDKKERLKSPDYLEKIGRLDFPITFIVGESITEALETSLGQVHNFVLIPFLYCIVLYYLALQVSFIFSFFLAVGPWD